MINTLVYIAFFTLLVSYLSSLNAFRLDMAKTLKQFSYFLLFAVVCEGFGIAWPRWIYQHTPFPRNNAWFYNIFHFITYLFYLYFFYHVLSSPRMRSIIKFLAVFYALFVVVNLSFGEGLYALNSYTELLNGFLMVFLCIAYFHQVLNAETVTPLKSDPVFWISIGALMYHLGSIMALFLINIINLFPMEKAHGIYAIVELSAIIMYVCFSIAFLWTKKK